MLKYCAVLSLCAVVGLSGDFITSQGARLVIGQTTFTSQNFGSSNTVFGSMGGLGYAPHSPGSNTGWLFAVDSNRLGLLPINNRVLMFPTESFPQPTDELIDNVRCPVCTGQATIVLGQPSVDNFPPPPNRTQSGMNLPTAVASDGTVVAVADTANNRVLLWLSIPQNIGQNADVVLGQPDFVTLTQPIVVSASSLRAPQGVWLQGGKLFVADTQNNRVLIWNSIPTKNNQAADIVLGQPSFTTVVQIDQTKIPPGASTTSLLSPTGVSTDGTHLFVADLGYSRVLIWNSIPTRNTQPADVEIGQKDMVTSILDDSPELCASNGVDSSGNPLYPSICAKTMSLPRSVISDGNGRLFVADTGNDRVLVYNTIPTTNAAPADVILGEPDEFSDVITSTDNVFAPNLTQSGSNILASPTSLAWDGSNLYVADPSNFRILVFTPLQANVQANGVVNAGSLAIFAFATVGLGGTLTANDVVTVTINGVNYTYTVTSTDVTNNSFDPILTGLANAINTSNSGNGDPSVLARPQLGFSALQLIARVPGSAGNNITLATTLSTNATITATASDAVLSGGGDASTLAPGTIISVKGNNLADTAVSTAANAQTLPTKLGGVEVYIDGIQSPLLMVSQTQINAQVPWELVDSNSSSLYVRTQHADGSISVTDAIGMPISQENPGIFAQPGIDPRPAIAFHGSSFATGTVSVDGGINAGDVATIGIEDRVYNYTVQGGDTLASIRDAFIGLINSNPQEKVTASAGGAFTRVRLQAKVPGPQGDGIQITATSTGSTSGSGGSVTMTALNTELCCANVAGALITQSNPAAAGETIYLFATGLGLVTPDAAKAALNDGAAYQGPALNNPNSPVSALAGGSTAAVVSAGAEVGAIGMYKVVLELNSSISTNPLTQLTISQAFFTSNIVTIPVYQPNPPQQ
jgi:uncharacterized protein (TIGR03437 family)